MCQRVWGLQSMTLSLSGRRLCLARTLPQDLPLSHEPRVQAEGPQGGPPPRHTQTHACVSV